MFRTLCYATVTLAASAEFDSAEFDDGDDGFVSLLQLRASAETKALGFIGSHLNSSGPFDVSDRSGGTHSGHAFGCTGKRLADNVVSCGMWGDVHQSKSFNGGGNADFNGQGWYWMAKSKDNSFQAQAFLRYYNPGNGVSVTSISHFAFKFGDQTLFLDRELTSNANPRLNSWGHHAYWNGEEISYEDCPQEVGPVYWANKAGGELANTGAKISTAWTVHGGTANQGATLYKDPSRINCFEFGKVAVWPSFINSQPFSWGPYAQPGVLEIEGNIDFLDPQFGQCAGRSQKVTPQEMLVTVAQNDKVCKDNKLSAHQCEDPDPPPKPPTKEELCVANGVPISHARDLCADQKTHGDGIYDGCIVDVCQSPSEETQMNAVRGAEIEAALMNPEAKCTVKTDSCEPCTICASAISVDLSNVVVNNLGGLGPDAGAEEVRYQNAIDLDGRKLDVVLTVEGGSYVTPKPQKNGNTGTGFGIFTLKVDNSADFKFTFVDSGTGEPVAVEDLALTFYDLDQAKKSLQQETITACGAGEVYTTDDTELLHDKEGACHSFTSTVKGTGKDNPDVPNELTKTQAARSVTFEFHSRASISFSASISGRGRTPRPILFSFVPQVACGASDAETRCGD